MSHETDFIPAIIYLLKVSNRNTRKSCKTCSKLTINTPCSSVSVVDSEYVAKWLDVPVDSRVEERRKA